MPDILDHILTRAPLTSPAGVDDWWLHHAERAAPFATPVDRAMAAAVGVDRLAWVFASGFHEALRALFGTGRDARIALCVTEEGGNHPRAIATELRPAGGGYRLHGGKRWVTLGTAVERLLVVAREGTDPGGRPLLVVVDVPVARAGVTLTELPPTPFVPEIPHARAELSDVEVGAAERLPGDGYARYVKPFRTVEDVHVFGAFLAWLTGLGCRYAWPRPLVSELAVQALAARHLALADPGDTAAHIALGGIMATTRRLLEALEGSWANVPPELRERWQRDRALLDVAGGARKKRLERAWETRAAQPHSS